MYTWFQALEKAKDAGRKERVLVVAVQGKQVSLEWTELSEGLWEWWHDPGVPLTFPVDSACS